MKLKSVRGTPPKPSRGPIMEAEDLCSSKKSSRTSEKGSNSRDYRNRHETIEEKDKTPTDVGKDIRL